MILVHTWSYLLTLPIGRCRATLSHTRNQTGSCRNASSMMAGSTRVSGIRSSFNLALAVGECTQLVSWVNILRHYIEYARGCISPRTHCLSPSLRFCMPLKSTHLPALLAMLCTTGIPRSRQGALSRTFRNPLDYVALIGVLGIRIHLRASYCPVQTSL